MDDHAGIALIYLPPGVDPTALFAGRSLIDQATALAAAGGLRPFLVARAPERERWGGDLDGIGPGGRLPAQCSTSATVVLWRCDVAWVANVLRTLLRHTGSSRTVVLDDLGRPAVVRVSAARLGGIAPASLTLAAATCTVLGAPGELAGERLIALDLATAASNSEDLPGVGSAPEPLGASAEREGRGLRPDRAARELIARLENPRDGIFDRLLNRPISRRVTPALLPFSITPNQVTLLSLLVGVLAAGALGLPGTLWPVFGALLLQATAVLDCIDGEIAPGQSARIGVGGAARHHLGTSR